MLLYQAATGRLPFTGEDTGSQSWTGFAMPIPDPMIAGNPDLPADLERIVFKCLAKDAARRYQSAGELLTDLRILARHSDPLCTRCWPGIGPGTTCPPS